jgi:hypothetical protein
LPANQPPPCSLPSLIPVRLTPTSLPKPPPPYWLSASNMSTGPSLRFPVPLRWSPALSADQPPPRSLPSLIPVRQTPTSLPKPPPSYWLSASNTSTGPSLRFPVPLRWSPALPAAPPLPRSLPIRRPSTPARPPRTTALEPCLVSRSASSLPPTQPHTRPTDSDFSASTCPKPS